MSLNPALRKSAELGIALTAIATLILAGCGGGSSTSTGGSSVASTTTTVTPFKGRFTSGTVSLKDANGQNVTLTGGGSINASGVASVSFPSNVTYPLTVNVSGTFADETTGASGVINPGSPLLGMIPAASDAAAASGVPVTAVTHFARSMLPASGISAASAVAAIAGAASSVLGVGYNQAMLPPVFDANGLTVDPNTIKLMALAHVIDQQGTGGDLAAKLNDVAAQLAASGVTVNTVLPQADLNNALAALNQIGGVSGVLPASAVPPTIPNFNPPNTGLGNQINAGIPTCLPGQVLLGTLNGLVCSGTGTLPAMPTGLSASAVSATQIYLSWSPVAGATGYYVYRSTSAGVTVSAGTHLAKAQTNSYSDSGLSASTAYYYKVVAANAAGNGQASAEASATTLAAAGASAIISGFNPSTGAVGTAVYINGTNLNSFTPEPLVKFGTTTAAVTSTSYLGGTQITVNVPAGLAAGDYAITVSNGDGSGTVNVGTFTVTAAGGTSTPLASIISSLDKGQCTQTNSATSSSKCGAGVVMDFSITVGSYAPCTMTKVGGLLSLTQGAVTHSVTLNGDATDMVNLLSATNLTLQASDPALGNTIGLIINTGGGLPAVASDTPYIGTPISCY